MATSVVVYSSAIDGMMRGDIDLNAGVVGYALLSTKNGIEHDDWYVSDVLRGETEVSDASYFRKYETLDTNPSAGTNLTRLGNTLTFDLNDVTWTGLTATVKAALIFRGDSSGGDDAIDRALAYVDLDSTLTLTGDDLTVQWHADGVFTVTTS